MMKQTTNLDLINLSTGYSRGRIQREVSRQINLSIPVGQVVMLMGPNGSGKSTLMHTIAGLLPPRAGEVQISGHPIAGLKMKQIAKLLSLVLTEKISPGNMNVWDIISIGRYPYVNYRGTLGQEDRSCIRSAVAQCRLEGMEHRLYTELSDGEKQRVMIARALTQQTPVILLDEPTAHLDLPSRLEVIMMLRRMARELDKTILISTHELDLALGWADTIWLMGRDGAIISGAPEDLVLQGDIERVFGNPSLSYDLSRGEFSVRQQDNRPIYLSGHDVRYGWTVRALSRAGYDVVPRRADLHCPEVSLEHEGWRLLHGSYEQLCSSIATLLEALQKLDT